MLLEDDNIHHVLHEIARRPLQRRRLRSITMDGRRMPFTATTRPGFTGDDWGHRAQPVKFAQPLYERALRQYFEQETDDGKRR